MKILLIEPNDNLNSQERLIFPSGALVLIGTMLKERGHTVSIIHMFPDKMDAAKLEAHVRSFAPEIAGITLNTFQTRSAKEISRLIKQINPGIKVVAGGPHPSSLKEKILSDFPDIDISVYGEGEFTFLDIVNGVPLKDINGISYKGRTNPPRSYCADLDYIPLPDLDLAGGLKKFSFGRKRTSMYIMASRGCPFHCTFCNKSVWGSSVRLRSPAHVVREIEWLHNKYGVTEIMLQDDTLNLKREWGEAIFREIIKRGLNKKIVYEIVLRANRNLVDLEFLKLAKEAGTYLVFFGVESGSQRMLDSMKKSLTIPEIKRAFMLAKQAGLKTAASFIIGLPGETHESIMDSVRLRKELNPWDYGFAMPIPFPGTELEKDLRKRGHLLNDNYDEYFLGACLVRTDALSPEDILKHFDKITAQKNLERIHYKFTFSYLRTAVAEFIKNPSSIFRRLGTLLRLIGLYR